MALKLPRGVTKIGSWAFNGCTLLESIDLSACIRLTDAGYGIENDAFAGCTALKTVIMPTGAPWMKKIRRDAFKGCKALSSIDLSGFMELTTIEASTFQDCTALKEVRLPKKLTTIGTDAFKNCPIETLVIHCDIKDSIITEFTYKADSAKTLTLGEGVTVIGANAFQSLFYLEEADLSACTTLTRIEAEAFFACTRATIKLPESITTIGSQAFGDSAALDESCCKKVLIKSGAEYNRIKGLVTGSGYPEARIEAYN